MKKTARAIVAVAALASLALGAVATSSAAIPTPRSISVLARTIDSKVIGPGLNAGDVWILRGTVYNKQGKAAGVARTQCTLNFGKTGLCTMSFYFTDRGHIILHGPVPLQRSAPVWLAVVGGTGKYRNARGEAHVTLGRKTARAAIELLP